MSLGFIFSFGDIVAALDLVRTIIDSVRSSSSAPRECQALLSELSALERILALVNNLDVDDFQSESVVALRQVGSPCQQILNDFARTIAKTSAAS